ncbi:MAG: hypothetical protein NTZ25_04425 [Candidatus Peregrinibacteria bacterium]|nr:hypothetical protein [Candidatus Peregrinibacteria bacterium]
MKTPKLFKSLLLSILGIAVVITTAHADNLQNITKYTPDRPGVNFVEGMQGFPYPTFNNFINQPNLIGGAFEGDERKFAIGKYCPAAKCDDNGIYVNTIQTAVKDGDVLRMELYFHNNGEDAYDNGGTTSPDAKNVQIGVDLNNIQDPDHDYMVRPRGFITADNNEYRTDRTQISTQIKDANGNVIHTATDDLQVLLSEYGLELQPVKDSAWLYVQNQTTTDGYYDDYVKGPTSLTFKTVKPATQTINVSPNYTDKKMWLNFDRIPGCFRYSGFAYFDVKVVKKATPPNVCTELKATLDDKNPIKLNGNDLYPMTVNSITFAPQNNVPNDAELKWTTDDSNGKFYFDVPMATPKLPPKKVEITKNADGSVNTSTDTTVYYSGKPESKIKVTLDNIPADQVGPLCNASMQTPAVLECTDLLVDHPEHIYENTYSVFKAKALGSDGKDLTGKIKYWVDSGYGEFYTVAPTGVAQNKSKMVYEATPTSKTFPFGDNTFKPDFTLDPKIFVAGNSNSQAAETFIYLAPKFAAGTFGIQDVSGNIQDQGKLGLAVQIKFLELPKWVTSPIPMNINPVDPNPNSSKGAFNPSNYGQNNVLLAVAGVGATDKIGNSYPTAIDGTKFMNQPSSGSLFDLNIDPNKAIGPGQNIDIQNAATLGNSKQFFFSSLFESITVDPGTTVYFNAKKPGKGVIHVQVIGSTNPDCSRTFDIEGLCKTLALESSPANPLVGNEITLNKVTLTDSTGKVLPSSTNTNLTTTAGGTFKTATLSNIISAKVSDFPVKTTPTKEGTVTVTMDPNDPAYSAACSSSVTVSKPASQECTALTLNISEKGITTKQNPQILQKNKQYIISASLTTKLPNENMVTYSIDKAYGSFFDPLKPTTPIQTMTVGENTEVILQTYDGPVNTSGTDLVPNVLKVNGVGYGDACSKPLPFNNPAPALACNSINVDPHGDSFDPTSNAFIPFTINGNFKDHNGEIRVSIKSSGVQGSKPTIKRADGSQSTENGYITFTSDEVKNSNNQLGFIYTSNNFGDSITVNNTTKETLDIITTAVGSSNTACNYPIHKEVSSDQTCEKTNSCPPGPDKYTAPTFSKASFVDHNIKDAGPVSNLKKTNHTVTYAISLDTGNNISDLATIWDASLKDGGTIYKKGVSTCNPTIAGCLQIKGMEINWVKTSGGKVSFKKTLFKDNFNNESYKFDSELSDDDIKDLKSSYELNDCSKNTNTDEPCIDTGINKPSLDAFAANIKSTFSAGGGLKFRHLGKLSTGNKIIIKYQMDYVFGEDLSSRCERYKNSKDGCGEQFENTAYYTALKKTSGTYSENKTAKVVAICPYVLSRNGGDVFFHDVVDTGSDVSQCYEVKSCDGPCIQPESDKEKTTPSTGTGASGNAPLLKSPSHDVCSKSNISKEQTGGNEGLDAYQDVLKNFSSSICELRADVSKAWTKQNVTDSINANVKRLSRFGSNISEIPSASSTHNLPQDPSGVFVKVGGSFTIGNGLQDYVIGNKLEDRAIPAAQTYIVIGGNLRIKSNIVYDNNLDFVTTFDKTRIASAAFIVIGGNIEIDDNVSQIDGIIMAVEDSKGNGGKIKATGDISTDTTILNINGNLIGDVYNLFKNRQAVGDPLKDQGSVNIHYDERILLNPPSGINELINLQQVVVPN